MVSRSSKTAKKPTDRRKWQKVAKNIYQIGECSFQVKMEVAGLKISKVLDTLGEAQTYRDMQNVSAALDVHEAALFESRIKKRESKNYLVKDAIDDYRTDYSEKKKGYKEEGNRLDLILRLPLSAKPLFMVQKGDIVAALSDIRSGKFQKIKGVMQRKTSEATAKRYWNLLRHIFEICRTDYRKIDRTPFSDFGKAEIPKDGQPRDRRLVGNEYQLMFDALTGEARIVYVLAVETSMRKQELLGIEWQNIDKKNHILKFLDGKTGGREVPLSQLAMSTINTIEPQGIAGKVFTISSGQLKYRWKKARALIGSPDLRLHDMRHESVSRAFESGRGLNVAEIKVLSGHKSLASLERYANLSTKKVAEKLG